MAQTVASHAVAALTSPVNGDPLSATVVLSNDNTVRAAYVDHDADSGIHLQSSALASRPAFGTAGRKWLSADTGSYRLFFDTGSAWAELTYLRTDVAGTMLGALTVNVVGVPQMLATDGTVTQFAGYADTNVAYSGTQSNHAYAVLTNNAERLRVLAGGDVGIGTASPTAKLHVSGSFLVTGASTLSNTEVATLTVTSGSAPGPAITTLGDSNTGIFFPSADALSVATAGTEHARVSAPSAGETSLWVYDADDTTLRRVTVGAADSGGSGFKVLRIPN